MVEYRYDRRTLLGDYARAAAGLMLAAGPLLLVDTGRIGAIVLVALAFLFLAFGLRTGLRQVTRIRVDSGGVTTTGPFARRIRWDDLASVVLNYYTTKRGGRAGWMQLKVTGGGVTVSAESTLSGFADLVERIAREAAMKGVELPTTTRNNMRALKLTTQ